MAAIPPPSASTDQPSSFPPPAPKILLAKPVPPPSSSASKEDLVSHRSRSPSLTSLNLLSLDSWEFHTERALPFLTENTDFTVVGVIGPTGVGKSTIMNEIYGFDGSSPGMLLAFATQTEETRAMSRHCTNGIEMRVSTERLILLDAQPIFSPSLLMEMMRPDGSLAVPVLSGETLSAELANEMMAIQLGVFLSSICHLLLVVTEGVHDTSTWHLMSTVDLLKHNIPDPSMLNSGHAPSATPDLDKEHKDMATFEDFFARPIFIHTKLQHQEMSPSNVLALRKALSLYFSSSLFNRNLSTQPTNPSSFLDDVTTLSSAPALFLLPADITDDSNRLQYESFPTMLEKLRDKILSAKNPPFQKVISERDWVRNSAKIWDMVKKSATIAEYCKMLQSSGLFRR